MTFTNFDQVAVTVKELSLVDETDRVLHSPSNEVDVTKISELTSTIDAMWKILRERRGLGLAAPQCGENIQLFIMELNLSRFVIINPRIISTSDDYIAAFEGCLSYPGLALKVTRPAELEAVWYDETGELHREQLNGLAARCFLHEYDHLHGVCFVDRVSKLALDMAKKKQKKQTQPSGNVSTRVKPKLQGSPATILRQNSGELSLADNHLAIEPTKV